jgi:hypothetical protein
VEAGRKGLRIGEKDWGIGGDCYRIWGQVGAERERRAVWAMESFCSWVRRSERQLLELAGSVRRVEGKSEERKSRRWRNWALGERDGEEWERAWMTASSR